VTVYSRSADGNVAPLRTIAGDSTLINEPRSLAVDTVNSELWVANSGDGSITVYRLSDSGDVAPKRRIKGHQTGLGAVEGLAVDAFNGEVAITNLGLNSIVVHGRTADGDTAPLRTISGPDTYVYLPAGVVVDLAHDELIVVAGDSLLAFGRTASGNVAPLRRVFGATTLLGSPCGLALDPYRDQLIVANQIQTLYRVTIYSRDANGDVGPLATIAGGTTQLNFPQYLAVASDGAALPAALAVDRAGNGVLEPGESVVVSPSWTNTSSSTIPLVGLANSFTGPAPAAYTISDGTADYANITPGTTGDCASSGGDCYVLSVSNPAVRPSLHWDAAFSESVSSGNTKDWTIHVGNSFADVPSSANIYPFVETILHNGLTAGCGTGNYCPALDVTRGQMAVFLLRARYGSSYVPSDCTTPDFGDVPCSNPFSKWINDLYQRGVTGGCGPAFFCPDAPVTRAQLAVFLLRTLEGTSYMAPPCVTPTFGDLPCTSGFARWVDELALRGIVVGCGGGNYCPDLAVTRGQMAVFLTATFGLKLYGP